MYFTSAGRAAAILLETLRPRDCKTPPMITRYAVWLIGRRCFFSTEKISRDLGYRPAVGYDEGIAAAVAWANRLG